MAVVYWVHLESHTDVTTEGYVGFSSTTLARRKSTHLSDSKKDKYSHYPIYKAINKYGGQLIWDVLLEGSKEYCLLIENKLRPTPKIGWNLAVGGESGSLGTKASLQTKEKLRESHTGNKNHFFGKKHSEETKRKISESKKGKSLWTEEQKQAFSKCRSGKKLNLSPEQRANRSLRARSIKPTEETKKKLSESRLKLNLTGWKSHKAGPVWKDAVKIYSLIMANPDLSSHKLSNICEYTNNELRQIHSKIKSGWNPSEDSEYMKWLMEQTNA